MMRKGLSLHSLYQTNKPIIKTSCLLKAVLSFVCNELLSTDYSSTPVIRESLYFAPILANTEQACKEKYLNGFFLLFLTQNWKGNQIR